MQINIIYVFPIKFLPIFVVMGFVILNNQVCDQLLRQWQHSFQ